MEQHFVYIVNVSTTVLLKLACKQHVHLLYIGRAALALAVGGNATTCSTLRLVGRA